MSRSKILTLSSNAENFVTVDFLRKNGIIHEINRKILHPLGLAMAVETWDDQKDQTEAAELHIIRDPDPEGWVFAEPIPSKVEAFKRLSERKHKIRRKKRGWIVQPIRKKFND